MRGLENRGVKIMAYRKSRHAWLRDALIDRGKMQKDVAKAWGCDEAVVSRFIRLGEPELTFQRAEVLSKMLGINLVELQTRLAEKPVPAGRARATREPEPEPELDSHDPGTNNVRRVLDEVRAAVDRARMRLPDGYRIKVSIEYGDDPAAEFGTHGKPARISFLGGT
jgi:hypothetical protein